MIIAVLARPSEIEDIPVTDNLRFLKAKILYFKHLYAAALHEYASLLASGRENAPLRSTIIANMGEIYLEQNKPDKALQCFRSYLDLHNTGDLSTLRNVYSNMAICLLDAGRFDETNLYLWKSIAISEQLKDTVNLAKSYLNLANQYYLGYQDKAALKYFKQGLAYAEAARDLESQENACINLSIVEEQRGRYATALGYRKRYEALHDSIYNRDNVWSLAQQEKRTAIKEKELRFELAQQKARLEAAAALGRKAAERNSFIVLAFAFLAFFILAFFAYRNTIRKNKVITRQREELDMLNRTKDQLFSVVAHDLRSPVQTLKISLSSLRGALIRKDIGQAERISGEIRTIADRTYSLLNNLLYWVLSQTGQLHFAKDKLDVRRLVDQVLYDYAPVAAAKSMTLENCVTDALYCSGDINAVKIMLRNLVDNAIKFSAPFTPVIISGRKENEECIVSVTDDGKGIDAAVMQALTNKSNKRVDGSNSHLQSPGIGLWLVKTMAEQNGGSLQIEKKPQGTRMNIHLPQFGSHEQNQDTYC